MSWSLLTALGGVGWPADKTEFPIHHSVSYSILYIPQNNYIPSFLVAIIVIIFVSDYQQHFDRDCASTPKAAPDRVVGFETI